MINFTAWPEMLAWPYLILKGWLPYRDIAIAHNPLLILILTGFYKIVGVGIMQLKIFTWGLIIVNSYLTYFVAKKYWSNKVGYVSGFLYIILCIIYQGNGLWFDLALTPFALLLYLFIREKRYLYAGLIFGLGFLTKQTFIYFLIPILLSKINVKKFLLGIAPVFVVFTLYLFTNNLISSYYDWAIKFGILYLPNAVGQVSLPSIKSFLFAVVPFSLLIINFEFAPWVLAGALGVYSRWELFHFQPALPFLAIAISILLFSNRSKILKVIIGSLLVAYLSMGTYRNLGETTRFFESDVQEVSSLITSHQPAITSLYVINYWDNIYALTNTLPNKPLIPYIPWYLNYNNNKQKILDGLKLNMPEVVVIGEKDINFVDVYDFVDKFYNCKVVEKQVELCEKNK